MVEPPGQNMYNPTHQFYQQFYVLPGSLKHNLITWTFYSIICYIILLPLKLWIIGISISLLIGFLFELLNDILIQLRKINGEKFPGIENDKKDEIIKS